MEYISSVNNQVGQAKVPYCALSDPCLLLYFQCRMMEMDTSLPEADADAVKEEPTRIGEETAPVTEEAKTDFAISTENIERLKTMQQVEANAVPTTDEVLEQRVPAEEIPVKTEPSVEDTETNTSVPTPAEAKPKTETAEPLDSKDQKSTSTATAATSATVSERPDEALKAAATSSEVKKDPSAPAPSTPSKQVSQSSSAGSGSKHHRHGGHHHHRRRAANIGVQCRRDKTLSKHVGFGDSASELAAAAASAATSLKYGGYSLANPCPALSSSKYKYGSLMKVETYPNGGGKTLHMWQSEVSAASEALAKGCLETKEQIETEIAEEFLKVGNNDL